jgi:hypothetical protein
MGGFGLETGALKIVAGFAVPTLYLAGGSTIALGGGGTGKQG